MSLITRLRLSRISFSESDASIPLFTFISADVFLAMANTEVCNSLSIYLKYSRRLLITINIYTSLNTSQDFLETLKISENDCNLLSISYELQNKLDRSWRCIDELDISWKIDYYSSTSDHNCEHY